MGRGRAPCCAKVGLNKGSWTQEEDMRLVAYIHKHGHGNWRALPKLAGLLRCGKSCRLRWINYLRPDIKRGNFTKEEEEAIIKLHGLLGNKWSKIASLLPGRTDNEIKNVWNTHLKKRLASPFTISSSSASCHEQDRSKPDKEGDCTEILNSNACLVDGELIEIPIDANMDLWSMLEYDSHSNITPSSSSSIELVKEMNPDPLSQEELVTRDHQPLISDEVIDPNIWSMMINEDDDACSFAPELEISNYPCDNWFVCLEEELGLRPEPAGSYHEQCHVAFDQDPPHHPS
ncbi:myb-related protein Zm1-like [Zingiber officinale]|uniref:Uncharacterized protein n=1 Tax=Zingiber officinale TaxID=94328 RepID=A0A8J5HB19_ZINOF|nr:myb-related protein Zm1-like [Zingiber officinale]KAG6519866.1 hypothetical protein ZIOFF_016895 [Zingiber officinale]